MADVSAKLIGIFAANLADMLTAGSGSAGESAEPAAREPAQAATSAGTEPAAEVSTAPAAASPPREDSLNLLGVAALPVLKRIAAPAGALLAVLAAVLIWRRRRRQ
jgi:hypothetical protein